VNYRQLQYLQAWPLQPHSDLLDSIFESNKLKALASFQDLYVGLEPYRNEQLVGGGVFRSTAPAVFGLLAAMELHPTNDKAGGASASGLSPSAFVPVILSVAMERLTVCACAVLPSAVFAPIGGFQSVTNALEGLATDLGVEIWCNSTVTGVDSQGVYWCPSSFDDQRSGGESRVCKNSEFLPADLIVVNADLPYAKASLLLDDRHGGHMKNRPLPSPTERFDWDDSFSFSRGIISFHWSIDKSLHSLSTHNVFLVAGSRLKAESSWQIFRRQADNDDAINGKLFNFYVHRPAETDPLAAPPGCDSITVLVPCRTLLRDEDCAKLHRDEAMEKYKDQFTVEAVSQARRAVLRRLAAVRSLQNLEPHIIHEVVDTPATWADQFHLAAGTPFGLVRNNCDLDRVYTLLWIHL
jgi:phytoene dehydrogenase-like protein